MSYGPPSSPHHPPQGGYPPPPSGVPPQQPHGEAPPQPPHGLPQPPPFGAPPPKKNNGNVLLAVVAGLVAVVVVGVVVIFLFRGGSSDGTGGGEDGYPQSYEPTAAAFTGGEFEYVPGFDLCGAFSHAGIEQLAPVFDVTATDEFKPDVDSGLYRCQMGYDNSETHGDEYIQGYLEFQAEIFADPDGARK
ncbi:hypothetical protein ACFQ3B_04775 [Stackebrandtia endophytica]|uniref:hypothetical protein n=1 Tax=Stackebrandtia endophytica TaxID=1496996 RepID=UPI001150E5E7|nr:hypothetical protein [Stackebrandtia endophytica]